MFEQRFTKAIEVRAEANGILTGRAVRYGAYSTDKALGYRESFRAGAFKNLDSDKIFATRNHNPDNLLARVGNGSLKIEDTPQALNFRMQLDLGNSVHRDTYRMVQDGLLRGCSFGFDCNEDDWDEDDFDEDDDGLQGRCATRVVRSANLYSCDIVTSPAYNGDMDGDPDTMVQARAAAAMFPQGLPVEIRARCPALADLLKLSRYVGSKSADEIRRQNAIRQRNIIL